MLIWLVSPSEVKVPIITRIPVVFNKIRTHIDSDRDLVSVEMPHTGRRSPNMAFETGQTDRPIWQNMAFRTIKSISTI